MLKVSVEGRENPPDIEGAFDSILNSLPDRAIEKLRRILLEAIDEVVVTLEVVGKFPFLKDKAGFVEDYMSCLGFSVDRTEKTATLMFSPEQAKKVGLSPTIHRLLEFGSRTFPACPHFRILIDKLDSLIDLREHMR